jgi:predicted nucleic acid-binding protein
MSARFFLDTNVLVYTFDAGAPRKREVARDLVRRALAEQSGVISTQVIQEFLRVACEKFAQPMTASECIAFLDGVLVPLCDVVVGPDLHRNALRLREDTGYGFYDALIVSAALSAGCATLYSEDLQDRRAVGSLRIRNPFAA